MKYAVIDLELVNAHVKTIKTPKESLEFSVRFNKYIKPFISPIQLTQLIESQLKS